MLPVTLIEERNRNDIVSFHVLWNIARTLGNRKINREIIAEEKAELGICQGKKKIIKITGNDELRHIWMSGSGGACL